MRIWVFSLVVSATVAAGLHAPGRALAGPVEQLVQVALHPADPDVMVLRYDYGGDGLLYSDDGGMTFKLVCLSAIDPAIRSIGSIAVAGDGRVSLAHFDGLLMDQGGGCGFSGESVLSGMWISELVVDPEDPMVLYAATSASMTTGGPLPNGLYRRSGDGAFEQFGTLEELLITRLRLTPIDGGMRVYQSAIHGTVSGMLDGMMVDNLPNYVIRVSDDGAETFTEFVWGAGDGGSFRLAAVDPTQPDRIVAVLDRTQDDDELLISTDRGETFTSYHTLSQLAAIEIAPDGRVFIGEGVSPVDPQRPVGFWAAASLDEAPEKLGDYPTQCLAYQASTDTLFGCQRWIFGTIDPATGAFSERMSFKDVGEFAACDGVDMAASCKTQLCNDYCGLAHFAEAGVCAVYDEPFCGRCVAAMESGRTDPECDDTSGGTSGTGGGAATDGGGMQAGAGAAGAAAGAPAGEAGGAAGQAGSSDDDDDDGGGGGCACTAPGRGAADVQAGGWWFAGLLLALALIARKRR